MFLDFKKAFDRVWHAALWVTMRKYNISPKLVRVIQQLYNKPSIQHTSIHLNIFLEHIMMNGLVDH